MDSKGTKELMEQIESSTCFGLAFDASIKECKICDTKAECSAKMKEGKTQKTKKPTSPLESVKSKVTAPDNKPEKKQAKKGTKPEGSLPDFKSMTLDELQKLATERCEEDTWSKHENEGIRRMRVTMALKKTYN